MKTGIIRLMAINNFVRSSVGEKFLH